MPVEAKHSAVPESKVRGGIVFFLTTLPPIFPRHPLGAPIVPARHLPLRARPP